MSQQPSPFSEHDLHAYVDGQLDSERRGQLEAFLATHPDELAKVEAYREQNRQLHTLFGDIADEPVPVRLTNSLKPSRSRKPLQVAAMLAWLFVGAIGGYVIRGGVAPEVTVAQVPFTQRAAVAHVVYTAEVLHPVEVGAAQEAHLVQWLSKRLGHSLHTPDLTRFGYQLIGGRLLPGEQGAAAQFMYQDVGGERLTLYVSVKDQSVAQSAFRFEEREGEQVLYWVDNQLGFALIGNLDRQRLLDIGHVVYQATSL